MSDILNPIFFNLKNFDDEEAILSLEKYMLFHNSSVMQKKNQSKLQDKSVEISVEPVTEKISSIILPKQTDTLFWCMFIAKYGYDEYQLIHSHSGNKEIEEKKKITDYFVLKNRGKIRSANKKISVVKFQEMISELLVNKKITLSVVILFVLFYDIDILVVYKKTYMEFSSLDSNDNKSVVILYRNDDGSYEIDLDTTDEKIANIVDNYLKMESEQKSLKGISSYKMDELKEIYSKITGEDYVSVPKQNKIDIYNTILLKTTW
jgi:hypothetical protein